jgi:two-component system, cell cycle sensor histidine kinase and response regulator CckA
MNESEGVPGVRQHVNNIPAIVWQADPATLRFRSVEGAAEEMLGYPTSHWLTRQGFFEERIHPEDRSATIALYREAMIASGEASAEYRAVTLSGKNVWCRETIRCCARTDKPKSITGVVTNITQRKQLERQLLSAGRSDALSAFAAQLAHDLNNPLMIVMGYAEEVLRSLDSQDSRWAEVNEILTAAQRIAGVTKQLVQLSCPKTGPSRGINLSQTLTALKSRITEAMSDHVAVEVIPSESPLWAIADADRLGEAITALVAGTRHSVRELTHLTISVDPETIAESLSASVLSFGRYARITIRDDGRELEPGQRGGVFDLTPGKPANREALAAGLARVRAHSTIREWGGDIVFANEFSGTVESGAGSLFSIYLRQVDREMRAVETQGSPLSAERARRETVLVVDDEPILRELIRKILHQEGYYVTEADGVEEGLNVAAQPNTIDLLVTAVDLPGVGGRELARRLFQNNTGMKVLYTTDRPNQNAFRSAHPPGARFLMKPFTLRALLSRVRETLDAA